VKRKLFTCGSALSLILCLTTVILWVRSYEHEDVMIRKIGNVPYTMASQPTVQSGGTVGFSGGGFGYAEQGRPEHSPIPDQSFFYFGSSYFHSLWLVWSEGWWRSGGHFSFQSKQTANRLMLWDEESLHLVYGPGITTRKEGAIIMLEEDQYFTGSHIVAVQLPFRWLVIGTSPLPIAWLAVITRQFWRKRLARTGICRTCSYNLTGNTSGVCPECGSPVEARI